MVEGSLAEKFWNLQFVGTVFSNIFFFSVYLYFQDIFIFRSAAFLGIFDTGFKNILKQYFLKMTFGWTLTWIEKDNENQVNIVLNKIINDRSQKLKVQIKVFLSVDRLFENIQDRIVRHILITSFIFNI